VARNWTAVIPVKRLHAAKTRLRGAVPAARHEELALALVRDTAAAILACPEVTELLVVTDDPAATVAATELGARVVPELGPLTARDDRTPATPDHGTPATPDHGTPATPDHGTPATPDHGTPATPDHGTRVARGHGVADLNAALRRAAEVAGSGRNRAVLTGDLPALRPAELRDALRRVETRSFVPDAAGTGTVLLAATAGVALDPHFGVDSAAAHAASGARLLAGDWPGLRRDVDTVADLHAVLALGAGPHTRAVLRAAGRTAA
jgi:2-phospho-L-lactate guanylyltransferase